MSLDGVLMAYMMVKEREDLSQTVFAPSTNEAFKRMNPHTHRYTHRDTLTNVIGENAMCCIWLKNNTIG